ncbi:uroporphyrinogen decarboxylase family protein, partial [Aduncisulcus paluster]
MTPLERMKAFGSGAAYDRVPCCPFTGESFSNYFGYGLDAYNHDKDIIVDVITKTFEMFEPDNCSIGPGLHGMPEAMGAELKFFENDIPRIGKPGIENYGQIDNLSVVDPYKDGRL